MKIPKIQSSQDYDSFIMIQGNRNLNKTKIDRIKDDIESGLNLLPYCPIIVYDKNEGLAIIDGQHRYVVSKELGIPVYYVVTDEMNLYQIATMNSKQDKWKQMDFLKCYVELDNSNYKVLQELIDQFKCSFVSSKKLTSSFPSRKSWPVSELAFLVPCIKNSAPKLIELLTLSHSLFSRYKFYTDRNLIVAVQQIKHKGLCDFEFLREKLKKAPMMMDRQASVKEYIYNIERVYNHNANVRKVIF